MTRHISINILQRLLVTILCWPNWLQTQVFLFLITDDQVIGYYKLNIGLDPNYGVNPSHAELQRIYLRTSHQGHGYGKIMVQHATDLMTVAQIKTIWLGCGSIIRQLSGFIYRLDLKKSANIYSGWAMTSRQIGSCIKNYTVWSYLANYFVTSRSFLQARRQSFYLYAMQLLDGVFVAKKLKLIYWFRFRKPGLRVGGPLIWLLC